MSTTGYLLLDNRPATTQFFRTRRNGRKVTGTVDVHTWESAPDIFGPDTGLENALPYLLTRPDPGSYHSACDSDSTQRIVPWWMEAFHDRFTNNFAIGVSIATKAHLWPTLPKAWTDAAVKRAAVETARIADEVFLDDGTYTVRPGIDIPARWLTQAEAHAGVPGFVRHGTSDPGRRSDPWPAGAPEADLFLAYYKAARTTGQYATTDLPPEEDDMFSEDDRKTLRDLANKAAQTYHGIDVIALPSLTRTEKSLWALRNNTIPALQGEVKGLVTALDALSSGKDIDLVAVQAAAFQGGNDGAKAAITPEALADSIPDALVADLWKVLGERLGTTV